MLIRPAAPADLPEIQAIYAHHVLHGTGSFEEAPPTVEEMAARYEAGTGRGWCWLVARDATGVLGWACYGQYKERSAYRFTAEDSVYIRDDVRRRGVGRALLAELLAEATARGFRQMLAVIGDSGNAGSIGLHRSLGFERVAHLHAVGFKFGRWLDSVTMQRPLGPGSATLPGEPQPGR